MLDQMKGKKSFANDADDGDDNADGVFVSRSGDYLHGGNCRHLLRHFEKEK